MADVKWIKLVTNIFDDEKIKYIETLPNGDETIVIWFRLLCLAGKSNSSGMLMMTDRIAYTEEMLSSIFARDIKSIQLALNIFENLEMIERFENKIYLTNWLKHQDLDKIEAKKLYDKEYQRQKRQNKQISYDNRTTIVEENHDNRSLDIELELDKEKDIKDIVGKSRFTPPTLKEVESYIKAQGYDMDASRFVDFYQSKGWMVGKNKMKDWEAAVRNWSKDKPKTKGRVELVTHYPTMETSDYDEDALNEALKNLGGS